MSVRMLKCSSHLMLRVLEKHRYLMRVSAQVYTRKQAPTAPPLPPC